MLGAFLSVAAFAVAVVALAVAFRTDNRSETGAGPFLVLGARGQNVLDCVSDTLRIFAPAVRQNFVPPTVRLKVRGAQVRVSAQAVQGGYYAALTVRRGTLQTGSGPAGISVKAGDELIVRVDGYPEPIAVDVRGRWVPSDGGEQCESPQHQ